MAEVSPRVAAMLAFLQAGRSVCPFARSAAKGVLWRELQTLGSDADLEVTAFLDSLTPKTPAAVLLAPSDPVDHRTARDIAEEMFGLMVLSCVRKTVGLDRSRIIRRGRAMLHHPTFHAAISAAGYPLFTNVMGPAYRADHPRHAPHLCVVLTWQHEIQRATVAHPGVTAQIRESMLKSTGVLYDAVTYYLEERHG